MTTTQFMHEATHRLVSSLKMLAASFCILLAIFALSAITTSPARAAIGTTDTVPAATLMLPYFEVALGNENGAQTALRVTNTSATAILLNVVLWTDYGVPTYSFPIYEEGYASADIDLRLLFKGIVPVTASAGQDPTDQISPKGEFSQDINFASCNGTLPPSMMTAATVTALQNAHTGQSSTLLSGNCGGVAYGDNIARGYITIDTVNQCGGPAFPGDPGYLASGGAGKVTNQNVVAGTAQYLNRSQKLAFSEPLVAIEASPGVSDNGYDSGNPLTTTSGNYTFYGRYDSFTAADNREPLASVTQGRYLNGGTFTSGSDLVVWRDPGVAVVPFTCGGSPTGFPLTQAEVVAFDEQEHFSPVVGNTFPYATQVVSAIGLTPYTFGFFRLNLTMPGGDPAVAGRHQSYVSIRHTANGTFGGALPAQQLNNASNPANTNFTILPPPSNP
jgi:hypothetical protein